MKKDMSFDDNPKKAGYCINIKVNFTEKNIIKNKKNHFIIIKRSINQEYTTTSNTCTY